MNRRVNVQLNDSSEEALSKLSERNHTTDTETIRRALKLYKSISDELSVEGTQLFVRHTKENGQTVERELVIL